MRRPESALLALLSPRGISCLPGKGLLRQAKLVNTNVVGVDTMCSLEPNTGIPEIDELARYFGRPEYHIEVGASGIISNAGVDRTSPCGSTSSGASSIKDKRLTIENLNEFALTVCHECRASRFGHSCDKEIAGLIHLLAIERALQSTNQNATLDPELRDFMNNAKKEHDKRKQARS